MSDTNITTPHSDAYRPKEEQQQPSGPQQPKKNIACPSFSVEPIESPATVMPPSSSSPLLSGASSRSSSIQHTAYFITSNGQSAFLDPLCETNSAVYCAKVKASGTELRYIFDTSTPHSSATSSSNADDEDAEELLLPHHAPTDTGCHVDLAILSKASIIRGPSGVGGGGGGGMKSQSPRLSAPLLLHGFAATEAAHNQTFKLGNVTITALLLRGSSPTEAPASACCFLLTTNNTTTDEMAMKAASDPTAEHNHARQNDSTATTALFTGDISLVLDLVKERQATAAVLGAGGNIHRGGGSSSSDVDSLPESTIVYVTHRKGQ